MANNAKSRKYQLTINNPNEHGYSHAVIKEKLNNFKLRYGCLGDEIGKEGTYHTHIYFYAKNAVLFSTVKKHFPEAHIEAAKGSSQDNRDYIRKEGEHSEDEKGCTTLLDTFEEFGEMPLDKSAKNQTISEKVLEMLEDGYSNLEIMRVYPSFITKGKYLEDVRQELLHEEYGNKFRDVKVHYIFGSTRTGKTTFVKNEAGGYDKIYRTSSYKNPFDGYTGQPVLLLEEFNSSLPIEVLLEILEGHPFRLDARYSNKVACYTEVYIVSNLPLEKQYEDVQYNRPEQWNAFLNRITDIHLFAKKDEQIREYKSDNVEIIELLKSDYWK